MNEQVTLYHREGGGGEGPKGGMGGVSEEFFWGESYGSQGEQR